MQNKTKYVLFHEVSMYDSLPLQLPTMTFKRFRFLGVIIRASHLLDFKKPSRNLFLLNLHLHQLC